MWTYIDVAGLVSSVISPSLLVQAVGDSEVCDVVLSQPRPHSLCLHTMHEGGSLQINLKTQTLHYIFLCPIFGLYEITD